MGGIPGSIPGLGSAGDLLTRFQNLLGNGQDFAKQLDGAELFNKLDTGGGPGGQPDGRISPAELGKALGISDDQAKKLIDDLQTKIKQATKDGALDQKELNAALEQLVKAAEAQKGEGGQAGQGKGGGAAQQGGAPQGGGQPQAAGGGKQGNGAQPGEQGGAQEVLTKMTKLLDTDHSGTVDETELQNFIDTYAGPDGKLTKDELETGLKALAQEHPERGVKPEEIDQLFNAVDTDGKDGISLHELTIAVGKGSAGAGTDE